MKNRNESEVRLGKRARAYRILQNKRGVVAAILVVAALAIAAACFTLTRPKAPPHVVLTDWGSTRAFSSRSDPQQLLQVVRGSYAAFQLYVNRDKVAKPLGSYEHAFDGIRSEAELHNALQHLFAANKDKYAEFLTTEEYELGTTMQAGKIVGVGLKFEFDSEADPATLVVGKVEGSAAKAGVQEKDILLKIQGHDVAEVPEFDQGPGGGAAEMVTSYANEGGPLGSRLFLTLERDGQTIEVEPVREIVGSKPSFQLANAHDPRAQVGLPDGKVMAVDNLYDPDSVAEFAAAFKEFTDKGIKGIVVDLTKVDGADGETALRFAAMLLDSGVIAHRMEVTTNGSLKMLTWEVKDGNVYRTTKGPFAVNAGGGVSKTPLEAEKVEKLDWATSLFKGDVIVVVSQVTAGGGEVIAAALKNDKRRCDVVADYLTAKKGKSQTYFHVGSDLVISVSTGFYLGPDGTAIEGAGVEPTIGGNGNPPMMALVTLAERLRELPLPVRPPTTP